MSGPVLFARYAYPPNERGYCGPDAAAELLESVSSVASTQGPRPTGGARAPSGPDGGELRALARGFAGAWPYLELIAGAHGIDDPLDERVVEAYWVGNELLRLPPGALLRAAEERFRSRLPRLGPAWERMAAPLPTMAPHHSAHVLALSPWLGLLRTGVVDRPLEVLDRCRVRWGEVLAVGPEHAVVRSRPLEWDGHRVVEGALRPETVRVAAFGRALAGDLRPGDWCTMHWDWVCEVVEPRRLAALCAWSRRQLRAVNAAQTLAHVWG
ncbi:hypothetical protein GXB85_00250 [Cellulomonas sp. APG4]|uniref:DUF6390 family protein n=1 Tax=Cellulomonas sp. APG4 TaxID=1538656 RepID=UPI00137A0884|nr:hypothetical protein [Cellulomonas sp. APG4]